MILSLTAAAALVAGMTVDPVCAWNDRGAHRVTVPVAQLVDNYTDIPKITRDRLKARLEKFQYDELATISRDGVTSDIWQYSGMSYMHFGTGRRVCGQVRTDQWKIGEIERGMVYEQDGYTLIVPTVCSNLARVTRIGLIRRDRGAELQEELQTAALLTPLLVATLVDIPDLQDLGEWPESEAFGAGSLFELLYAEPLPFNSGAGVLLALVDIPEGAGRSLAAPVPELGTWALMLLGLGIVALWCRGPGTCGACLAGRTAALGHNDQANLDPTA